MLKSLLFSLLFISNFCLAHDVDDLGADCARITQKINTTSIQGEKWSPVYALAAFGGGGCPIEAVGAIVPYPGRNWFILFEKDTDRYTYYKADEKAWTSVFRTHQFGRGICPFDKIDAAYTFNSQGKDKIRLFDAGSSNYVDYLDQPVPTCTQESDFESDFAGGGAPFAQVGAAVPYPGRNWLIFFEKDTDQYTYYNNDEKAWVGNYELNQFSAGQCPFNSIGAAMPYTDGAGREKILFFDGSGKHFVYYDDKGVIKDHTLTAEQVKMMEKVMGRGYKAYYEYANILSSGTVPLFDYDELPKYINVIESSEYDGRIIEGNSLKDYSNNLSASISLEGGSGLFSAGISTSFNMNATQETENSYFTWNRTLKKYRLDITPNAPLREAVKIDIAELSPEALFDKYGTHYIQSAYIGGRIEFNTHIDRSKFSDSSNFSVDVKASYAEVSGETKFGTGNSSHIEEFIRNARVAVIGGDASLGGQIELEKRNVHHYENWRKTVTGDNMTLADFANNGLLPISELAATQARKDELKAALTEYLLLHGTVLPDTPAPKREVRKNSTFVLRSNDNRLVSRPTYKFILGTGNLYYPLLLDQDSINNFRVAGLFTFNENSKDVLTHGNTTNIMFKESVLYPWWTQGKLDGEDKSQDQLSKRFLKMGGLIPHAHYWLEDGWANWTIKKVGGKQGDIIKDGDEVYIYNQGLQQYLIYYINGGTILGTEGNEQLNNGSDQGIDGKFIWKIELREE